MGRDKGQRTKGNVKPASSGRTAELLFPQTSAGTSGSTLFSGGFPSSVSSKPTFQTLAGNTSFVPILDDSLESRLAIPLRKLGKKDPTTKIKALDELIALCTSDSAVAEQILPYYPAIYTKLSTDESKKVRELAQSLLQSIGKAVGRTLATQLKQLLPSWYLGINDTYPPASTVAEQTFNTIFPTEEKQLQALKFALAEICTLVKERLFSSQEFDKITGLAGLKKLLPLVENDYIFDILKQDQFWALGNDESSQIRGSFYLLLCTLGETNATLIPKSKLTKAVSTALKEEKVELSLLWNCFLILTMNGVFDENVIARKELLVLCKNSFYGNANNLGPLVLPLIDKIGDVGEEIFEALEQGFNDAISNSEKLAIIRTYAETLAYYLQHEKEGQQNPSLPTTVLPFLTRHLKQACEFGHTFASLLKTSKDFYQQLVEFCTEEIVSTKEFGYFTISFLQKKKSVSFVEIQEVEELDFTRSSSSTSRINYTKLPENKQEFIREISKKVLAFKAFKAFAIISRLLKSTKFYEDILENDLKKIPAIFDFSSKNATINEETKVDALKISLDLIQLFPELPTTLLIFSTVYDLYFSNGTNETLDIFIQELDNFDELKPIKTWLKMDLFIQQNSPSVLKYILRKGTTIFPAAVVQEKINQVCSSSSLNIEIVRDLLIRNVKADLTQLYLKVWDLYLTTTTTTKKTKEEDLEQLCLLILEKDVLSHQSIYDKLLNIGSNSCLTIEELNHLIQIFAIRIVNQDTFNISQVDMDLLHLETIIDSDFLVFNEFKYPKLHHAANLTSSSPAHFQFYPFPLIKKVLFEAKLGFALQEQEEMNQEQKIQLGLNLIFIQCLYNIWEASVGKNIWNPTKKIPQQFLDEISTCLQKIIEQIVQDKNTRQTFWNELITKNCNEIWISKYPIKYFLQLAKKMDLTCFNLNDQPTMPNNLDNIEWIYENYLIGTTNNSNNGIIIEELITKLETLRKDNAEEFQFDKLYSYIESDVEKQRLFDLLTLTIELMQNAPANNQFLSTGTCWISAWIKMSKNIQFTKMNYLWLIELCRGVILIDELVKQVGKSSTAEFVQEYIEFHALNLYPNLYAWLVQLLEYPSSSDYSGFDSYWRLKCCEKVISALARVPKTILTHSIEQDSNKIFEKFMPLLKRKEITFKISAFKIMRKVVIKDDIIIPKDLLEYLEEEMNDWGEEQGEGSEEDEGEEMGNSEDVGRRRIRKSEASSAYGKLRNDAIVTYLLAWDTLLTTQPNTADLSSFIKADNLLPKLLSLLFLRLIPQHLKQYFENEVIKLNSNNIPSISHLACHVLHHVLSCFPYTVRWWWSGLMKQRDKVLVEKIITKHLSGKLAAEELSKVKLDEASENITVLSHPGCNELVARYKFEETSITLTISLPLNYPLGPLSVQVSDQKLHAKISQLLNTRTHSLSAGLKLWKESLDDTYKDVDECTICFYVIHFATKQLPKLECRTCKKKFHSACLYKWFSTSNKSECPLCKSLW